MMGRSQAIITSWLNILMNQLMNQIMRKRNPKYLRATVKSMNKKRCFKSRKGGTRMSEYQKRVKIELFNDHFENAKRYQIPRAQLIIADIPYNIGKNAYGSRSDWYVGG